MKKLLAFLPALFVVCFLISCSEEDLDDFIKKSGSSSLTDSEIIDGLKTALTTGTDSSTSVLSKANGYFNDAAVKILLPQEIQNSIANLKAKSKTIRAFGQTVNLTGENLYNGFAIKDPFLGTTLWSVDGVKQKESDLILGLNRAAEAAAKSAGPVFKNAITTMTITDGLTILNGADTAATGYLRGKTFNPLFKQYEPIVDSALNNVKVGEKSVVQLYEDYVGSYNSLLTTDVPTQGSIASLLGVNTVAATDVSEYGTNRALDGLFLKVSKEEQKIRLNPFAYVSEILRKVFGKSTE